VAPLHSEVLSLRAFLEDSKTKWGQTVVPKGMLAEDDADSWPRGHSPPFHPSCDDAGVRFRFMQPQKLSTARLSSAFRRIGIPIIETYEVFANWNCRVRFEINQSLSRPVTDGLSSAKDAFCLQLFAKSYKEDSPRLVSVWLKSSLSTP